MRLQIGLVIVSISLLASSDARSQTLVPTSGSVFWNVDGNWSPATFPNSTGAAAVLPAPTGALTIDLGQNIKIGSLNIGKAATGAFDTTITGSTNTLTFDGGTALVNADSFGAGGTGITVIDVPIAFTSGLTITQNDNDGLRLQQAISGTGNLTYNRGTSGTGVVAVSGANTYSGTTQITGNAAQNYMLVRLNSATAIPGGIGATGGTSNITFTNSAILGLRFDDFKRSIGTGVDQFQFSTPVQSGWAAFIENRAVNIGGASAQVTWNQANFNPTVLVLGHSTADKTIDFQNPLNLTTSGTVTRQIRIVQGLTGPAAIDAIISGGITYPGTGTSNLTFIDGGTVKLTGASTYNGITTVNSARVIFNHASAMAPGNLIIMNTGVIGLGAGDFTRSLGTGAGQVQFQPASGGTNSGGGWAAFGANRIVNLGGASAPISWNSTNFIGGTGVTGAGGSFFLSVESSDAMVDFQNPIDLAGAQRTIAVRDGSAPIDARVSGVLSGTGASLLKGQAGTLDLSAANTYDGTTTIQNGVLLLTNANSIPGGITGGNTNTIIFSSTGAEIGLGNGNFTSDLGTGPGKVQFTASSTFGYGFAAYGADRAVNLGGASAQVSWGVNNFIGGQFILSAVGADKTLDFQNPIDLNGAVRTFDVRDGSTNVDGLLSGVLSGTGGGIAKISTGTLKLTANNTYDGGTTVSAGRLLVSNTTGSGTGTGAVTVNSGGTLGGTGAISGAVTVNLGGHIAPGESIGSLNVGSLLTNTGSVLDFELGAPGSPGVTSDLVNVTNTDGLTLAGGSVALTNAGGLAPGTYTLIDYAGALGGDVANLGTPTGPAGFTYTLSNNTSNTSIDLTVAIPGVPGDFNGDSHVNAADYVTWRKNDGTDAGYVAWRENFSQTSAAGTGLSDPAAVPEPATIALVALVAPVFVPLVARRKRGWTRKWDQ